MDESHYTRIIKPLYRKSKELLQRLDENAKTTLEPEDDITPAERYARAIQNRDALIERPHRA